MAGNTRRKTLSGPTLAAAVEVFFADRNLAKTTRAMYRNTYKALIECFGPDALVGAVTATQLCHFLQEKWGMTAPASWNARVASMRSLMRYCQKQKWRSDTPLESLEHRRVPRNETRAISYEDLDKLWIQSHVHLREKLLWRMLYSTAARAQEILSLDVNDLDLPRKRGDIIGKGGHREVIIWDAKTARLLRRYLDGRTVGPLFLTHRLPTLEPADLDRAADGRARLSYKRAWTLFRDASEGHWTLHQLRHSSLTHLGEKGVAAPLLMAKSRHQDLRTLSRYVRPGVEAVARLTAEHDSARRQNRD